MFPIVFSTDHKFVIPTCVCIHSLLTSSQPQTVFHINIIIGKDVTEDDKDLIKLQVLADKISCKVSFIEIGNLFDNSFEIRDISVACYNRLMIPWLLPEYDKVVYSDVDIIYKEDISPLYEIELGPNFVAGVGGEVWGKGGLKKYLLKIGANPEQYVNSGLLLINSKLQREQNLKETYISHSKRKYLFQDQDIINIICKDHIEKLPSCYNVKPADSYLNSDSGVKIIHYTGLKPWNYFTYRWTDWWNNYRGSIVFNPVFEKKISGKILKWNHGIGGIIKKIKQKIHFSVNYIFFFIK